MRTPRGRLGAPLLAHLTVIAVTAGLLAIDLLPPLLVDDSRRYAAIATGPTFWVGQPVEFPPGSALMVWFVGRWGAASPWVLLATNVALDLGTAALLRRHFGVLAANRYLGLTAILLPLTLFRLDHLSVLWVVGALALWRHGRVATAGGLLGLGALVKLWPAVLLAGAKREDARFVVSGLVAVAMGTVTWIVAFGPDAVSQVLTYRGSTGWHVESLVGSLARVTGDTGVRYEAGAWRTGDVDPVVLFALVVLGGGIWVASRRLPRLEERALVLVTGLLLVAPLFSLQYMLWLVPLVAILPAGTAPRRLVGILAIAASLSMLIGFFYNELLLGTGLAIGTLALRNLLLVGLLVLALTQLRGRTQENMHG